MKSLFKSLLSSFLVVLCVHASFCFALAVLPFSTLVHLMMYVEGFLFTIVFTISLTISIYSEK